MGKYVPIQVDVIELTSLNTPPRITVELGESIRVVDNIKISGTYSDGSVKNGLEYLGTYSIDPNPTLNGKIDIPGNGTIKGLGLGTTYIYFKYLGKYSKGIQVDVIELRSLQVISNNISVEEGTSIKLADQVQIIGTYSDGSTKVIRLNQGTYNMATNIYASIDGNGNIYGRKGGGATTVIYTYKGKQCSIKVNVKINVGKKIIDSLRKLQPSKNVIIYCPSIDGKLYWVYDLRTMSFNSNYDLVSSGHSLIFLDTNWELVQDPKILVKLETVWQANFYFEQYYAYYASHNVGWMSDYWNQQNKAFRGYMISKGIYNICQDLSSALIGGFGKQAVSKTLASVAKDYIKDAVSLEKAAEVVTTCVTYNRLDYVKQLDDFYVNMVKKKQSRILTYEEAYNYISLNDRAMGIIPAVTARNTVFGMDDVEGVSQLIVDYWKGVATGVILIDAKTPSWLSVQLSPEFIKKCEKALATGNYLEAIKAFGDKITVFKDLYNSMQGCETVIQRDTSGHYQVTLNYHL